MKKTRIFQLLIGSILSGVLLVGCNNNDNPKTPVTDNDIRNDIQNPRIQNPADNNLRDDNNDGLIDNNNLDDDDVNDNDRYINDRNTDTDKDPVKDINTKKEEIIEDDLDRNDRDNRDQ